MPELSRQQKTEHLYYTGILKIRSVARYGLFSLRRICASKWFSECLFLNNGYISFEPFKNNITDFIKNKGLKVWHH
jgi:hypothetical protein